jgi:hypothetical protein
MTVKDLINALQMNKDEYDEDSQIFHGNSDGTASDGVVVSFQTDGVFLEECNNG